MDARSRINREGPALAFLTLCALTVVSALALGIAVGVEECGYALFLLIGVGTVLGRGELAEVNRRVWVGIFGGTGSWVPKVWRPLWAGWGVLAISASGIALISSVISTVT